MYVCIYVCVCVCVSYLQLIVLAGNKSFLVYAPAIKGPVCLGADGLCVCNYIHVYARVFVCHYLFSLACFLKVASLQPEHKYDRRVCACVCVCVCVCGLWLCICVRLPCEIESRVNTHVRLFPRWSE